MEHRGAAVASDAAPTGAPILRGAPASSWARRAVEQEIRLCPPIILFPVASMAAVAAVTAPEAVSADPTCRARPEADSAAAVGRALAVPAARVDSAAAAP